MNRKWQLLLAVLVGLVLVSSLGVAKGTPWDIVIHSPATGYG